ncbi:hypothetical protein RhiirB3_451574 [Rhizophagus irregularis]|nr:hypothetical protein RhiirB3_451574 [Rhizophagus irregularis]
MSELKSNNFLYGTDISKLARIFGFTKDPYLDDYILVMECASGGDLIWVLIMWELTTGCKPFANVEHGHSLVFNIIDCVRPEITEVAPECYANLMKKTFCK